MNSPITLKLSILTPLHIGNGKTLTSVGEYVLLDGEVKIIDQDQLSSLLQEKEINHDYIDFLVQENKQANIWDDFFEKHHIQEHIRFKQNLKFIKPDNFDVSSNNLLELALETVGEKYIPGSSIKGAFRSLLFAKYIEENRTIRNDIEAIIAKHFIKTTNAKGEKISAGTKLNLIGKETEKIASSDKINTFFKGIRLVDSNTFTKKDVQIEVAKRVHFFKEQSGEVDLLRECLKPLATTQIELYIKPKNPVLNKEPYKDFDVQKLFETINDMSKKLIVFEIELLTKSKLSSIQHIKLQLIEKLHELKKEIENTNDQHAIMRLGKGKTIFFQTIIPLLSVRARKQLIALLVKDIELQEHFPNTRMLSANNEMFGWVKITKPKVVIEIKENNITTIKKGTPLVAYNIDNKTARFILNNTEHTAQLIRPHKSITYLKNKELLVVVWQLSKEGKINQLKVQEL